MKDIEKSIYDEILFPTQILKTSFVKKPEEYFFSFLTYSHGQGRSDVVIYTLAVAVIRGTVF